MVGVLNRKLQGKVSPLAMHGKVVVLMNKRSGGKWSAEFAFNKFIKEFGNDNVFELFQGDAQTAPERVKAFIIQHKPVVIIVAGGDGTISFVMDVVKELHDIRKLPRHKGIIAPFPLGTGNDFSNSLGFGCGFARWLVFGNVRFQRMLHHYAVAKRVSVDRWSLTFQIDSGELMEVVKGNNVLTSNIDECSFSFKVGSPSQHSNEASSELQVSVLERRTMNNYVSVWFEADVAARLNQFRSHHPHLFVSRPVVKLWYAYFAVICALSQRQIGAQLTLEIDNESIAIPSFAKALVVSSVLTYAGGSVLWNCEEESSLLSSFIPQSPCLFPPPVTPTSLAFPTTSTNSKLIENSRLPSSPTLCPAALDDAKVEVSCLCGMWHLSCVRLGLCNGIKLGQGNRVKLAFPSHIPCQYDGEPLSSLQRVNRTITLDIQHHSTSSVLRTAEVSNRPQNWVILLVLIFLPAILILTYSFFASNRS